MTEGREYESITVCVAAGSCMVALLHIAVATREVMRHGHQLYAQSSPGLAHHDKGPWERAVWGKWASGLYLEMVDLILGWIFFVFLNGICH